MDSLLSELSLLSLDKSRQGALGLSCGQIDLVSPARSFLAQGVSISSEKNGLRD